MITGASSLIKYFTEDSYEEITGINFTAYTEDHEDDILHQESRTEL